MTFAHEQFGEGPLEKYPSGQLAGGLLYRPHGSNGGIGETCSQVTRPDPTHSSFSVLSLVKALSTLLSPSPGVIPDALVNNL
jgi:hypothetical protein